MSPREASDESMADYGDCSVGSRLLLVSKRHHHVEFVNDHHRGDYLGFQFSTSTMPVTTSMSTTTPSTTDAIVVAVPIDSVESGLFCRDLYGLGYGFRDAVAYWMSEGQTARMDADRNGVPCETVHKADAVEALYGSADARGMHLVTTVNYVDTSRFVVTGSAVRDGVICETGTAVAIE